MFLVILIIFDFQHGETVLVIFFFFDSFQESNAVLRIFFLIFLLTLLKLKKKIIKLW